MADKIVKEAMMFESEFAERLEKLDDAIGELEEMTDNLERISSYKFPKSGPSKKNSSKKKR
jgi:hypothetical protein